MSQGIQELAVVVKDLEAREKAAMDAGEALPDEVFYEKLILERLLAGKIDQAVELRKALEQRVKDLQDAISQTEAVIEKVEQAFEKALDTQGTPRLEGLVWTIRQQTNGRASTIIEDEQKLPRKYRFIDVALKARFQADDLREYRFWASVILRRGLKEEDLQKLTDQEKQLIHEKMVESISKSAVEADLKLDPQSVPGARLEKGKHLRIEKSRTRPKEVQVIHE